MQLNSVLNSTKTSKGFLIVLIIIFTVNLRWTQENYLINNGTLLIVLMLSLALIKNIINSDKKIHINFLLLLLGIFVYYLYLFLINSVYTFGYQEFNIENNIHLLSMLIISLVFLIYIYTQNFYRSFYFFSKFIFYSMSILSLYGIIVFMFGSISQEDNIVIQSINLFGFSFSQVLVEGRMSSLAGNSNTMGSWLMISILLSIYLYKNNKSSNYLIGILLQIIALYLSFSRTSILALLLGVIVLFALVLLYKKKLLIKLRFIIFIIIPLAISSVWIGAITFSDLTGRQDFWYWGITELINSNPIIGQGYGSSEALLRGYGSDSTLHNYYLTVLYEGGILGLALIVFILLMIYINLYKLFNNDDYIFSKIIIFSIFITITVHQFFETTIFNLTLLHFCWLIIVTNIYKIGEISRYEKNRFNGRNCSESKKRTKSIYE
ncbi:O-antigen ligase family protein [Halalkalibacillus halophilus]|uniref:O-antigen ligase family protein n=1 Tax=Halalkalibacillus halophilus TaxID=392827 RepID=UPI0004010DC3|nr:O-antigen ligase family protein [Halalkalibacillus halophilus]